MSNTESYSNTFKFFCGINLAQDLLVFSLYVAWYVNVAEQQQVRDVAPHQLQEEMRRPSSVVSDSVSLLEQQMKECQSKINSLIVHVLLLNY